MNRVHTLEVALGGETLSHVDEERVERMDDVLQRESEDGNGHRQGDGRLSALAERDGECTGQDATDGLVRRNISANRDGAHEQQLEAGGNSQASLEVTEDEADERAQDDGAECIERTKLPVESAQGGNQTDEDGLNKHVSSNLNSCGIAGLSRTKIRC